MIYSELTIKPRAPQKRAIENAQREGQPIPIHKTPFTLKVPTYQVEDIITFVEQNNQKVLEFLASKLNEEIHNEVRNQLTDDELFPVDQEVDITAFDMDALDIEKISRLAARTNALQLEFTEEQFEEFAQVFVATMLPKYEKNPRANVILLNIANVLINGFKDIRNEQDAMDKVKEVLDTFVNEADEDTVDTYADMYDYFTAMYNKRTATLAKKKEKTDVFLD